jgi:hypothetical protein
MMIELSHYVTHPPISYDTNDTTADAAAEYRAVIIIHYNQFSQIYVNSSVIVLHCHKV